MEPTETVLSISENVSPIEESEGDQGDVEWTCLKNFRNLVLVFEIVFTCRFIYLYISINLLKNSVLVRADRTSSNLFLLFRQFGIRVYILVRFTRYQILHPVEFYCRLFYLFFNSLDISTVIRNISFITA